MKFVFRFEKPVHFMFHHSIFNKAILFFLFASVCFGTFFSCNKPTKIGAGLLPDEDNTNTIFTDTLTLVTTTVKEDSLRTDNLSAYLLGAMDEPVFGKSFCSIYTQILLPSNDIKLEKDSNDNLTLDSVVLTLAYSGFYGDKTTPQTLIVYQLTESMDAAAQYESNKTFSYSSTELGRVSNFIPNTTDSIDVYGKKYPAHLRIKLNDVLGNDLLAQSGTANFKDNTSFLSYFKGIYLLPDTTSGKGMMYFNLTSTLSALTLYYSSGSTDSLSFNFIIGTNAASMTHFQHSYTGSTVATYMNQSSDSIVFVQSMAGVKAKIKLPTLQNLGKILINKAELIITEIYPDAVFISPDTMICLQADSSGKNSFTSDQIQAFYRTVSPAYLGGNKISKIENGITINQYKFNLAFHLQTIADNPSLDYGLYLLTFPSSEIADRVILAGGNHSQYKMKLNLTYSKIN